MFGWSDFWLETRVIIKISTHPWYPRNFDQFSSGWSKNIFFEKKIQNGRLKKTEFFKIANSQKKICENFVLELAILKIPVFLSRPFWIFFFEKKNLASSPWKLVKVSWVSRMGRNFDDYPGFQPKITPPKHFSRQWIYTMYVPM